MNLFNWLVVAHLVGDWLLQNDWMAQGKLQAPLSRALLLHCTLYTLALMLPLCTHPLPLWQLGLVVVAIFASHWLIDGLQLAKGWGRLYGQTQVRFVQIMADQTLHMLVLAAVAWWHAYVNLA